MNRGPGGHCAAVAGTLAALQRRRSKEDKTVSEQARTFERVRESFAKQGLMKLLGAKVSEVGEGWRVKEAPYGEKRPSEPARPPFTPTETPRFPAPLYGDVADGEQR